MSLQYKGQYVPDILPTVIEDLCRKPNDYELEVIRLEPDTEEYLASIRSVFQGSQRVDYDTDAVRSTYDAIQSWLFQLPRAALTADSVSPEATRFQRLLQNSRSNDPLVLLMRQIPECCGVEYRNNGHIRDDLMKLKMELERVSDTYMQKAAIAVQLALARNQAYRTKNTEMVAKQWANYFPEAITATGLPSIAKSLLSRMRMNYDTEELFLNSLALLVIGRPIKDWDDSTSIEFEGKIQELTHKIETSALRVASVGGVDDAQEICEGLSHLIGERIE